MKKLAKKSVAAILGWQVRRLRKKNTFKIIGIAGSVGKTSTKFAVASVLGEQFKVQFQAGNYNDVVTVPLIFFGQTAPQLLNPLAWLYVFIKNEVLLQRKYPYDVVVVELGTDGPGQIKEFSNYLELDMAIVTAITPEHMEFFKTIERVAEEELAVAAFSRNILVNADLCAGYLSFSSTTSQLTYGFETSSDYKAVVQNKRITVTKDSRIITESALPLDGTAGAYSVMAAVAVANEFGVTAENIQQSIPKIQQISGRLKRLTGVNQSTIIDDTYNASPVAVKASLDILYGESAPQKIAILGSMNELGDYSPVAHAEVGEYCDPSQLELVVTIGRDANKYLAAAAEKRGCKVARFTNSIKAGEHVQQALKPGALVLAKGSQNGVFAEEAIKVLLADPVDEKFLVRQNRDWMIKKRDLLKD